MPRAFPANYEQQYNDWKNSRFVPPGASDSDLFVEFSTSPAGYYTGNAVVEVEFDGNGIMHDGTHMFKVAGAKNSHFDCFRCQRHKTGCKASLRLPKRAEVGRRTAIVIKFHMHSRYTSDKYNTEGRLIKCVNLLAAAERLKEAGVDLQNLHRTGEVNDLDEELDEELEEDLEMVLEARTHFKNYFDEEEAMEIDEEEEAMDEEEEEAMDDEEEEDEEEEEEDDDEEDEEEAVGEEKESVVYVILGEDFDEDTDSFLDAFASVGWVGQRIQSLARRGSAQRTPFSTIFRMKEKMGPSMKYTLLDVIEDIPRHKRLQGENLLMGLFNGLYGDPNAQLANWVRGSDERDGEIILLTGTSNRAPTYIQDDAEVDSWVASYLLLYGLFRERYTKYNYNFTKGPLKAAVKNVETQVARLNQELAESQSRNEELEAENVTLREENATIRDENEALREENEALTLEVAGLRAQLARAQNQPPNH